MMRTFDRIELEKAVSTFDPFEWDNLLFEFKFDEIDKRLKEEESVDFSNMYQDPSIPFTPILVKFMKAALNADKVLAKQ